MSLDLRREALLEWMAPLLAALSSADIACVTASPADSSSASTNFLALVIRVLARLRSGAFRRRLLSCTRADLALGNFRIPPCFLKSPLQHCCPSGLLTYGGSPRQTDDALDALQLGEHTIELVYPPDEHR